MALLLSRVTESGIETTYHRVDNVLLRFDEGYVHFDVQSWKDADTRKALNEDGTHKYMRVSSTNYDVPLNEFKELSQNGFYNYLKTLPEWEGATDA